ncbi:hypothetical protein MLAC_19470 [Mycobacterium lacus]|uniref:Metallo-beta-lactamase domain-containing protein n=1 Tax=Mycobacterium lacus TaxID=169765 RepID=A0A7I7NK03_9MYCO|nr:hypothetical protein MLAC_19470 [Mycobacterium lacus]
MGGREKAKHIGAAGFSLTYRVPPGAARCRGGRSPNPWDTLALRQWLWHTSGVIEVTLLGTGRGVLQRAAAVGVSANALTALLVTHLHSDHIADLGDVLITRWVTTFGPEPAPLPIIGPPGTAAMVKATLAAFSADIAYRIAHHADLTQPPAVEVHEHTEGGVGPGRSSGVGGTHGPPARVCDDSVSRPARPRVGRLGR